MSLVSATCGSAPAGEKGQHTRVEMGCPFAVGPWVDAEPHTRAGLGQASPSARAGGRFPEVHKLFTLLPEATLGQDLPSRLQAKGEGRRPKGSERQWGRRPSSGKSPRPAPACPRAPEPGTAAR